MLITTKTRLNSVTWNSIELHNVKQENSNGNSLSSVSNGWFLSDWKLVLITLSIFIMNAKRHSGVWAGCFFRLASDEVNSGWLDLIEGITYQICTKSTGLCPPVLLWRSSQFGYSIAKLKSNGFSISSTYTSESESECVCTFSTDRRVFIKDNIVGKMIGSSSHRP